MAIALSAQQSAASTACAGDCDGDGSVAIAELITGVTIGLEGGGDGCADYRCGEPGCVLIHTLVNAVEHALRGCPGGGGPPGEEAPPPTAAADEVVLALEAVQRATCHVVGPISQMTQAATPRGYAMYCMAGPGHDTRTGLARYESAAAAAAQWQVEGEPGAPFDLQGLPAAAWEVPFQIRPLEGAHRFLVWQLGCWVITVHTFDDTHYRIAPSPRATAEAILAQASDALLAQCPG